MDGIENTTTALKGKPVMKSKSLENTISGAVGKIETEIHSLQAQIRNDSSKIETLTSKSHQLQQQTEIYAHECQVVREKAKDANWSFTKETSQTLLKIKKPTPEILDLSEKFMILLEQKEKNWKMFQASLRNYESLKALMDKFNPENIREENVDQILGLWKNYSAIQPKVAKVCRGASILLDWVTACMEFKIKKATLESIKRTHLEVQNNLKEYSNNISEKQSLIVTLQEKLKELKENPPKEENVKKVPLQNCTQGRSNQSKDTNDATGNSTRSSNKLSKMLSSQSVANMHSDAAAKKAAGQLEENEQGSVQNASCEVKLEADQVNAIFSSTYRFPTTFGVGYGKNDETFGSSRKNSRVEKIYKIIANHDDRNKDNVVLTDSKILFVKEKTVTNTPNTKGENPYHEGHSIEIRQPMFEEDKTNSTYLNSLRNPLSENSNPKKKHLSTTGTNSGASIGLNTFKQDELTHRTQIPKSILTPRIIEDGIDLEINMDSTTRRNKKNEEDSGKNEEEDGEEDQSFAACCKKGINRFLCS